MASNFSLEGIGDLRRSVRALGTEARPVARKAVLAGAEIIAAEARARAPRGNYVFHPSAAAWRRAPLWRAITADVIQKNDRATAGVTVPGGLTNGANFYIRFIEWGTKNRNKLAARLFVATSAQVREPEAIDAVASTIKAGLDL